MAIPPAWMPDVPMRRVICHWTAGSHEAGTIDKDAYHVLIEGNGNLVKGTPSIALNSGRVKVGYAQHTLNCNSGSIGVSMCCMGGAEEGPFNPGRYPMTQAQWNMLISVVAELCMRYRIKVTPRTVLSHAEVENNLNIAQRGKWDISRLPFDPTIIGAAACGDRLREEVAAAMGGVMPELSAGTRRTIPLEKLLTELGTILGRALAAGLNTLIREIIKRIT
jgi:hypothetical protein